MKLTDSEQMWTADSTIDRTALTQKSLQIPYLHGKYYKLYIKEQMKLVNIDQQLRSLKLDKYEFYTQGPTSETPDTWKLPDSGRIRVKADVPRYLEADGDIQEMEFQKALQMEKVKFIESIIGTIKNMGFAIKNALDVMKFESGG